MGNYSFTVDAVALKKRMLDNGVETVSALSEKTGVDRNTLGAVLSGGKLPSSRTMYALVGALCISPKEAGEIFFARDLLNR